MDKEKIIQLLRRNKPAFHPLNEEKISDIKVKTDLITTFCENLKLVGAEVYDNFDEAKNQANALKLQGFDPKISRPLNTRSDMYRIYIGEYETVNDAEAVLKKINKKPEFEKSLIRRRF